ncbi:MAG: type IV pilus assembly protein PilM [Acidithiobacillus sp.]
MLRLPSPPLLGLDISPEAVKIVELSASRGRIRVENADSESLPAGAVNDREVLDVDVVTHTIRSILERSRIRTKAVATALPSNAVIVKVISLPADLNDEGIEEQIRFEGSQYIPYSIDAVNFDFAELGPDDQRRGYKRVLLVACKKETVEDRAAILEASGLKPKIIDVQQFTLWGLFQHLEASPQDHRSVALLEVGSLTTALHVFEEGQPIYSREHNFGVARLAEEVQRRYSLEAQDAQRMLRFGGLPQDYPKEVLQPFVRNLAQEIFRAVDFFQASMPDVQLATVRLFGAGATLPRLDAQLQQLVHIPVQAPDPFAGMDMAAQVSRRFLEADRSSLAVACGLALRRLPA